MSSTTELSRQEEIRATVRAGYAAVATADQNESNAGASCCGPSSCCGGNANSADALAAAVGYGADDLAALPAGANMGLSCGNPVALASLRAGETVLDLGSGGGFDVFIAGRRVGSTGRVIGVDMTPEMLAKARRNTAAYRERSGLDNVEFRLGEIENLPVADASVDVVISNCVINLSVDKARVYAEIARVLRPGGRVAVSDVVLKKQLPEAIRNDKTALVGCVSGALHVDELRAVMARAGLVDIQLEEKPGYVDAMEAGKDHIVEAARACLKPGESFGDYVASMNITATKPLARPASKCCG